MRRSTVRVCGHRDHAKGFVFALFFSAISLLGAGCGNDNGQVGDYRYRSDMYEQPSYRKYEDPLPPVKGTVPVGGIEPAIADSASAAKLKNPVVRTIANADSGRFLYETYCSPCHGLGAKGDGLVAPKFQVPPDLTTRVYANAPDGYMYYVIRHGRLIMPSYYESLNARERWLVVNHVRTLQAN
jgi:mono/diheme cytochrome c family protein